MKQITFDSIKVGLVAALLASIVLGVISFYRYQVLSSKVQSFSAAVQSASTESEARSQVLSFLAVTTSDSAAMSASAGSIQQNIQDAQNSQYWSGIFATQPSYFVTKILAKAHSLGLCKDGQLSNCQLQVQIRECIQNAPMGGACAFWADNYLSVETLYFLGIYKSVLSANPEFNRDIVEYFIPRAYALGLCKPDQTPEKDGCKSSVKINDCVNKKWWGCAERKKGTITLQALVDWGLRSPTLNSNNNAGTGTTTRQDNPALQRSPKIDSGQPDNSQMTRVDRWLYETAQ